MRRISYSDYSHQCSTVIFIINYLTKNFYINQKINNLIDLKCSQIANVTNDFTIGTLHGFAEKKIKIN